MPQEIRRGMRVRVRDSGLVGTVLGAGVNVAKVQWEDGHVTEIGSTRLRPVDSEPLRPAPMTAVPYGQKGRERVKEMNDFLRNNPPQPERKVTNPCYVCGREGWDRLSDGRWVCDECNTEVQHAAPARPAPKMAGATKERLDYLTVLGAGAEGRAWIDRKLGNVFHQWEKSYRDGQSNTIEFRPADRARVEAVVDDYLDNGPG